MKGLLALLLLAAAAACSHAPAPAAVAGAPASDGLVIVESAYSFEETLAKLEAALALRNLQPLKIDHATNAAGAQLSLRPTILFLFGNPRGGTPLMMLAPAAGIDLPLKALVYEEDGKTMVVMTDIDYLARRHAISPDAAPLAGIRKLLADVASEATGR